MIKKISLMINECLYKNTFLQCLSGKNMVCCFIRSHTEIGMLPPRSEKTFYHLVDQWSSTGDNIFSAREH